MSVVNVSPPDALEPTGAVSALALMAMVAALAPARRAAKGDPAVSLTCE
jgi:ABC-type lipoprotein release transport system permease subunit